MGRPVLLSPLAPRRPFTPSPSLPVPLSVSSARSPDHERKLPLCHRGVCRSLEYEVRRARGGRSMPCLLAGCVAARRATKAKEAVSSRKIAVRSISSPSYRGGWRPVLRSRSADTHRDAAGETWQPEYGAGGHKIQVLYCRTSKNYDLNTIDPHAKDHLFPLSGTSGDRERSRTA
jgi:hypothetical protein